MNSYLKPLLPTHPVNDEIVNSVNLDTKKIDMDSLLTEAAYLGGAVKSELLNHFLFFETVENMIFLASFLIGTALPPFSLNWSPFLLLASLLISPGHNLGLNILWSLFFSIFSGFILGSQGRSYV